MRALTLTIGGMACVALVIACSSTPASSNDGSGGGETTNDAGTSPIGSDPNQDGGGDGGARWQVVASSPSVDKLFSVVANGSSVWTSGVRGAQTTVQKIDASGRLTELWPGTSHACPFSSPCDGIFNDGTVLDAVRGTTLVVAGTDDTAVFVEGQSIHYLGPDTTVQSHDPLTISAASTDDVWISTGDAIWDVYADGNASFCPTTPNGDCKNGGFGTGLFYDGETLWMTVGNGPADSPGIWGGHPSGHPLTQTTLPLTLAVGGAFNAIAPGPSKTAWAVGDDGSAARFDGSTWASVPTGTKLHLGAAAVLASGDVWAVGVDGIVHYDGSVWSVPVESAMPSSGSSIAATADGAVWLVDGNGKLYRRNP